MKELSLRLFEWTNQRWIITFSKEIGEKSVREKEQIKKDEIIKKAKKSNLNKNVLKKFPDADLINVNLKNEIDK